MSDIYSGNAYVQIKTPCKQTFPFPFNGGGTAAAAPPPSRLNDPALCGSRPLVP